VSNDPLELGKANRIPNAQRRVVVDRAKSYCEYCYSRMDFSAQSFSIEHIIPRDKGGSNDLDNLALACQGCNNFKHTKILAHDPLSEAFVPLFHPRQNLWREHFTWDDEYLMVVGITSTGRATLQALKLNRLGVVNLRRALSLMDEHPPIDTLPLP
jgi:hypothetical protein